jgi:N-acetylmuramoyl-L-alanine amidase
VQRQPLPPKGSLTPLFVVNHNTEGATSKSSVEAMQQRGVSAHVVIERDGKITQCVPFNQIAYHAGTSRWRHPKTGILYANSNDDSIGIEIANAGPESSALAWASRQPGFSSIHVAHRNGGPICEWEVHPPAQIVSVIALNQALVAKYTLADVTGHDFIAPERKSDCGPAFPMQAVREACGFSGLPATHHP